MGACIVCNKYAGPFYSLHKACYQVYKDAHACLLQEFTESVAISAPIEEFAEALLDCRPSASFSLRTFESLVKRAWQEHAKQTVKSKLLYADRANYLLNIARTLSIEDQDVEPYLFTRLANIEHLARLNQKQSAIKNFSSVEDKMLLLHGESLIWVFEQAKKVVQNRYSEQKPWSIYQSILNNLFKRSRYKELAVTTEAIGQLAITNQRILYITPKETLHVDFAEIYSVIPMQDGVRIQTTHRDTVPNTYITGDGRFTYALLRYAQDQSVTE